MSTDCPVCDHRGIPLLEGLTDFHVTQQKPFDVQYCTHCLSGFSSPPMSEAELSPFYPDHYEAYVPKKGFLGWIQRLKYHLDLKMISGLVPKGGSLFEVGAGRGEFLAVAKEKGFQVSGMEMSAVAREFAAKNFDIQLAGGSATDLHIAAPCDLVIARHVLEHVNHPAELLVQIFERGLKPGGTLFLKLPNFSSWERKVFGKYWASWDVPRHRFHFSRLGIEQLLSRTGFHDIRIREEIVPATMVLSLKHIAQHGENGLMRKGARAFLKMPDALVTVLAQAIALLFAPFGSGRMIVVGRKP